MANYEEMFLQMANGMRQEGFLADQEQMSGNKNRAKGQFKRLGDLPKQVAEGHQWAATFAAQAGFNRSTPTGLEPLPALQLQAGGPSTPKSSRSLSAGSLQSGNRAAPMPLQRVPTPATTPKSRSGTMSMTLSPMASPWADKMQQMQQLRRSSSSGSLARRGASRDGEGYEMRSWKTQQNAFVSGC